MFPGKSRFNINDIVNAFPSQDFTFKHTYGRHKHIGKYCQLVEHSFFDFEANKIITYKNEEYGVLSEEAGNLIHSIETSFSDEFSKCKFCFCLFLVNKM
jgi:hypothetical protein